MTGELGIHGKVKPIGGVVAKVEAAFQAGATTVLIPKENWQSLFDGLNGVKVIPVESLKEAFQHVFGPEAERSFGFTVAGEVFTPPAPAFFQVDSPHTELL
ncbi:Lon protease 2 [compost metagenome]